MALKPLIVIAATMALAYAALCAWLYLRQRELIYFPQSTHVAAEQTNLALVRPDATLRGWIINPGQTRAILYFGGNAEAVEANGVSFRQWFPDHTVYLLAYRGYGASDGVASEAVLQADALALYDQVRREHGEAAIGVIGRSLGSGVASHLAAHRRVDRLALVTPFDSLARAGQVHFPWLPVRWLMTDRYDSARHLQGYRGRLLIVRAGRDEVIPATSTDRLIAVLPTPPRVVELEFAGHNAIDADPRYGEALSRFFSTAEPER